MDDKTEDISDQLFIQRNNTSEDGYSSGGVRIKKLDPGAKIPTYAYLGDAGMDLYCFDNIEILEGESRLVGTKIAIAIPSGYYGRIASRSGLSVKHKIEVGAGVIDSKYRGEIKVHLYNHHSRIPFYASAGSKIAQLIITKILIPEIVEVSELDKTDRDGKGFGSTG